MSDEVILRPIGRVSEPSHSVAPQGSLLEADNCVVREPGVVSPVPDLRIITSSDGPQGDGVWQMSPQFGNGTQPEQLAHVSEGTGSQQGVRKSSAMGTEIQYTDVDGTSASIEYYDHGDGLTMAPMYLARQGLYVGDKRGVYKWENTDASDIVRVWDETPPSPVASVSASTPTWLSNNNHVAYTAIAVFKDANDVITRSAPSPRWEANNTAGADRSTSVSLWLDESVYSHPNFDSVELYRTSQYANTVALPNSHGLVATLQPSDFSTTLGNLRRATHADFMEDAARGSAAYTDSGIDGLVGGNIAPPEHLYHATFKGHEFWGNTTERFLWPEVTFDTFTDTSVLTALTYTSASASATVTSAADLEVGMLISDASSPGTGFALDTYITAISGTTLTLSNAATASGSGNFNFYPSAYVRFADGSTERIALQPYAFNGAERLARIDVSGSKFADASADYEMRLRIATVARPGRDGDAQLWVNQNNVTTTVADLATSLGAPTTGGTEPAQSVHKRRLSWSKFQEPEHTTLANFQDVDGQGDIVGLAALRDALIILKSDGVYKLTGANGNWRIDPIDTSVSVIGGRSTAVMDNAVYTLGNQGLLRITSSGVENLTDNVVGDWFTEEEDTDSASRIENVRAYLRNNGGYHPAGLFAAADPVNREYVIMVDGTDTYQPTGPKSQMLVYNAQTGAFTTWQLDESGSFGISCLGYAEGDYALTAVQAPGIVVARQVSGADTSAALFIMDNRSSAKAAGYTDYTQNLRFRTRIEGDPTHLKQWIELAWDVDGADTSASGITAVFQAGETGADVTQAISGGSSVDEIRIWPPIAVSRSTKLVAGLTGTGITVYGLRLSYVSSGKGAPL